MNLSGLVPWCVGLTVLAVPLYLVAEHREHLHSRLVLKSVASLGFVGTALAAGATDSLFGLLILAGLLLCLAGDLFLISRQRPLFNAGLVSFLLGHAVYTAAFIMRGQALLPMFAVMLLLLPIGFTIFRWLRSHAPKEMLNAIMAYIVMISVMAAAALGTVADGAPWLLLPGALAFYFSDLAVARDRFVKRGFINRAWGLPLYYLGQILIALSAGS